MSFARDDRDLPEEEGPSWTKEPSRRDDRFDFAAFLGGDSLEDKITDALDGKDLLDKDAYGEYPPDYVPRRAASGERGRHEAPGPSPEEEEEEGTASVVHVCDYIKHQMESNELSFENPMYQQMMMEAWQGVYEKESFVCMKYFMSHQDPAISRLAADLLSERFVLSKYHKEVQKTELDEAQIVELTTRVMMEYLSEVLNDQIKEILEELKQSKGQNPEREAELMREMCYVNGVKAQLSKSLGERIILK